jgi:hypothetical protein
VARRRFPPPWLVEDIALPSAGKLQKFTDEPPEFVNKFWRAAALTIRPVNDAE